MRPRKYRNVPTLIDGITFDSKKESNRYSELKLLAWWRDHQLRWSPKTGQVAKRESLPGTVGWPEVRHGKYTEEAQS
jgi:hypothetical protein